MHTENGMHIYVLGHEHFDLDTYVSWVIASLHPWSFKCCVMYINGFNISYSLHLHRKLLLFVIGQDGGVALGEAHMYTISSYWAALKKKRKKKKSLVGLVVKASASVRFLLVLWGFFQVESYQWLQNGHSSGYPARRLGQRWDWLAQWQYTVKWVR